MRAGLILGVLVAGCGGGHRVVVDVRTDLSPRTEFVGVHTTVDGAASDHLVAAADDWLAGTRVAEFDGVADGMHAVEVTLVDAAGAVAKRRAEVTLSGDIVVTVLVSRSCSGVACPMCTADADCAASPVACAPARCVLGICLRQPDDAACGAGLVCDVASGCVAPVVDGGALDAGALDAGVDLGTDAGFADLGGLPSPLPYTTCRTCVHDADCLGAGWYCVDAECLPRQDDTSRPGGGCPQPLGLSTIGASSVDGAPGPFCAPPVSCAAALAFGMSCSTDSSCPGGGVQDFCINNRCTWQCSSSSMCPNGCDVSMWCS